MVTPADVRRAAALARLRLDESEVESLARDLTEVLAHAEDLGPLDENPGPETTTLGVDGLRADEPGADPLLLPLDRIAPEMVDRLLVVPRLASHQDEDGRDPGWPP